MCAWQRHTDLRATGRVLGGDFFSCLPVTLVRSVCSGSTEELMHERANGILVSDANSRDWLPSFMDGKMDLKVHWENHFSYGEVMWTPLSSSTLMLPKLRTREGAPHCPRALPLFPEWGGGWGIGTRRV